MTWSRSQYEDRIRGHLGDLGLLQHLPDSSFPTALERALATLSRDQPAIVAHPIDGDGTERTFDLTASASWVPGWSRLLSIEYPAGEIPRAYLDSHDYSLEDSTLLIHEAPVTGTGNVIVRHTGAWPFPDDDPSDDDPALPELYAQAVAELAASVIIRGKAVEYARQHSTSVAGDLFQRDAEALFSAAANLRKAYEETVLGRPLDEGRPAAVAMSVMDVDVFPASLFHRREEVIGEELYGS